MRTKSFLLAASIVLSSAPASARAPDEPALIPSLGAELFNVDRAHSRLEFSIRFLGMTDVRGAFADYETSILYDENDMTNTSLSLVIDVASIETMNDFRDRDLQSERFFHVQAHPKIIFQSDQIVRQGDGFLAHGRLTMRGVTREIAVPFQRTLMRTVDEAWGNVRIGFEGGITLKRSDYGIHGGDFWGIKALSDEVRIEFAMLGTRRNLERVGFQSQAKPSIGETLLPIVESDGVEAALKKYRLLKKENADTYNFGESEMNLLGYRFLQRGRADVAREILKLNAEVYPESANVYDSLGEAYAMLGQSRLAIDHYEKSLAIDPASANAMEMLRRLRAVAG